MYANIVGQYLKAAYLVSQQMIGVEGQMRYVLIVLLWTMVYSFLL